MIELRHGGLRRTIQIHDPDALTHDLVPAPQIGGKQGLASEENMTQVGTLLAVRKMVEHRAEQRRHAVDEVHP